MNKIIVFLFLAFAFSGNEISAKVLTADTNALETAKASLNAHGGEKLSKLKNLTLRGTVDAFVQGQSVPASFAIVSEGNKYRFEIQSAFFKFSQTSDGENTSSSIRGIAVPPLNRIGLLVLPNIEQKGYTVSALSGDLAKKKGFRITTPEGYYTDFIVDEKTNLVKEYQSSYEINERTISTAVAIDKYRDVEGILINEKFSQRIDMGSLTAYVEFKAKDIMINTLIEPTVFEIK